MVMVQCRERLILKEDGRTINQDNQEKKLKQRIKKKLMNNKK